MEKPHWITGENWKPYGTRFQEFNLSRSNRGNKLAMVIIFF